MAMADRGRSQVLCVRTNKTLRALLHAQNGGGGGGGAMSWKFQAHRVPPGGLVVLCRLKDPKSLETYADPHPHNAAFMVGRVRDVVVSPEHADRKLIRFDAYAEVSVPGVFPDQRNCLHYATPEELAERGLDLGRLEFRPIPVPAADGPAAAAEVGVAAAAAAHAAPLRPSGKERRRLSIMEAIEEARRHLGARIGVPPEKIEIVLRL
jgi:hypothetical protein